MFQYLTGGSKEDGDSLFTRRQIEKTRGNGYKLPPGRLQLGTRGKLLTMRTISHWDNLPGEVVDTPTWDTFKIQLDRVLGCLAQTVLLPRKVKWGQERGEGQHQQWLPLRPGLSPSPAAQAGMAEPLSSWQPSPAAPSFLGGAAPQGCRPVPQPRPLGTARLGALGRGHVPSGLLCHPDKEHVIYPLGSTVVIQHMDSKKQVFVCGHDNDISCVVAPRDRLYLASGEITSPQADIILWDFQGKELLTRLTLHKGRIEVLAFSPNSLYLVSLGGQDNASVVVWHVGRRQAVCGSPASPCHMGNATFVVCSSCRDEIFATAGSGTIRVWELDIAGGKIQPTDCQTGHLRRVATCLKMADDDYLYVGTSSGDVVRVNTNNKLMSDCRPQKQKFSLGVTALLLLKTGDLIVGTGEGSVALCKGSNYKVMKKIQVQGAVTSLTCSNQGHQFFVGTNECQIYRVNSPEFKEELIAACHSEAVNDVAFAVGSSDLFATCSVNDIRVWHTPVSTELRRFTHRNVTCLAIEVTKDATSIISVWNDGAIRALTPETGDLMYVIEHAHSSGVTALAATNDCKRIISGGREGEVRVWKIGEKACKLVEVLKGHKRDVTCIKIKKNDQECVTASLDGMCITWDLVRLTRKQMFLAHTSFKCVCYHPEEYQIITGGTDRKVGYWEVFDGSSVREVEGSAAGSINGMDITSDGACFVTGGDDGLVRLWDYNKGAVTYIGVGHSGSITRVKICPGKKYIVSASADGAILIWNLPPSH
ncbi:LOW QUALITY PROTEIN: cilia- and flagella-associated protein 52 [Podargus strigoides]